MKLYKIWLIVLKFAIVVQVCLIAAKVQTQHDTVYLITDILFKTSLGIFLMVYFYMNGAPTFDGWDEVFISFGGALLVFDAWYNVFPELLKNYKIYFDPYTFYWSTSQPRATEAFGTSPGTMDQLRTSHVPTQEDLHFYRDVYPKMIRREITDMTDGDPGEPRPWIFPWYGRGVTLIA